MDRGTSWRWQRAEAGVGVHRQEHSKTSNGLTLTNCSILNFLFGILVCRINKEQRYLVSYKTSKVFRIHIHAIFKCKNENKLLYFLLSFKFSCFTHVEKVVFFVQDRNCSEKQAISQTTKDQAHLKQLLVLVCQDQCVVVNQYVPG